MIARPNASGVVTSTSRTTLVAAATIAVCGIVGFLAHRFFPISDGAMFEYGGRAIARGQFLYRDVWDNKLPGVFLADALWQRLFGERYILHALAETAVCVVVSLMAGAIAKGFGAPHAGAAAAICAVPLLLFSPQLNTTETYALVPLLGSILCAQRGRGIFAGLLLGVSTCFWIPSVLTLALLIACAPKRSGVIVVAYFATLAAAAATFLGVYGAPRARELFQAWLAYFNAKVPLVHPKLGPLSIVVTALDSAFRSGVLAGLVLLSGRTIDPGRRRIALIWVAATLAGCLVGTRFYDHYFMPSLPALAFALAAGRPRPNFWGRYAAPGVAIVMTLLIARHVLSYQGYWNARARDIVRAGELSRAALGPDVTLQLGSYEPGLYLSIDPRLRSPIEIVSDTNLETAALHSTPEQPKLVIDELPATPAPAGDVAVCAGAVADWRFFTEPGLAGAFRTCGRAVANRTDSRAPHWWRQGDSNS